MAFINTIPEEQAPDEVQQLYQQHRKPQGYIPNYARLFSHRPQVFSNFYKLVGSIVNGMDMRRYELVTLAAARTLRSSYCMLAHGSILYEKFYTPEQLTLIAQDYHTADLVPAEVAMMAFAEKVAGDATVITQADVDELKQHGFSDAEIFEITTAAAIRCFFSKTLDALGAEPDEIYLDMADDLRQALTVGRSIEGQLAPEALS
jgi:uncharacterized peroxidase-related enzyme